MGEFAAAPLRAIPERAGRRHARPPASSATRRRVDILALLGASATRGDRGNGHVAVTSSNGNGTSRGPDLVRTVNIVELPPDRESRRPVLEADGVTVRFGGLTAVSDVSLSVREREITGLIGPNGAGKTTMFNAISGLNEPASGRIQLFGQDVTNLPVHARARLGVGRTFQVIQLFPQLDVFENLLVATHSLNPTGVLSQLVVTRRSVLAEGEARQRVERVIDLLELRSVAHRPVTGLPFGVLRMVEVARVMVTGAELIMLDEPASGLDNSETDRLAEFLGFIRATLGVTLLLIEHDVHMVTRVCDHIYVLDRGKLLADGPAERIKRDPEVVAAYLGTPAGAA
jgi:branched-chain amino acid transport system ATP-binding protein